MKRLIICSDKEYGKRLAAYLRKQLSAEWRISTFSDYETFIKSLSDEKADLYLLTYEFRNELLRQEYNLPESVIYLSKSKKEGEFSMWGHPGDLLSMIRDRCEIDNRCKDEPVGLAGIVGIYSPFSPYSLMECLWKEIPVGGLYLGFEDFSASGDDDSICQELYYYIHLRDSEIFSRLEEILPGRDGIHYLNPPRYPFDLKELTEEDFAWFLQGLRESGRFSKVYVSFGSIAASGVDFFRMFDQIIIMDWKENEVYRSYSRRMQDAVRNLESMDGSKVTSRFF